MEICHRAIMIYIHKILPSITSPLVIIILIFLLSLIFNSKKLISTAVIILVMCSLPLLSNKLIIYLERDYQLKPVSMVDKADAIVVLSGMVKTIKTKDGLAYEWGEAVDRIFAGIDLFKEKKAAKLILTRGMLPWSIGKPEGEHLRDVAISFGIPSNSILLTRNARNTDEEAKSIKKLLSNKEATVILVTSAFHMPRARKVFKTAGIKVVPFPVDFLTTADKLTFMQFIPSASALAQTSFFVREMIGRTYYNLKY